MRERKLLRYLRKEGKRESRVRKGKELKMV